MAPKRRGNSVAPETAGATTKNTDSSVSSSSSSTKKSTGTFASVSGIPSSLRPSSSSSDTANVSPLPEPILKMQRYLQQGYDKVSASPYTFPSLTGCSIFTVFVISLLISCVGVWTTDNGRNALAHEILNNRGRLVSVPVAQRGIFWSLKDSLSSIMLELPGFIVGFHADRATMYQHYADESDGTPVPFRSSFTVFSHKDVNNVISSSDQLRGPYLGTMPVPDKCMHKDTLIFQSTGEIHSKLRNFLLDYIPAFKQSDPSGTLLDLDFGTDLSTALNPALWLTLSDSEYENMVQRTLIRTLFRTLYQSNITDDTLEAFVDYASVGATCILGNTFHTATLGMVLNKVDGLRQRIRQGILGTPLGQQIKRYAAEQAKLGNIPNLTAEEQAGDSLIRQLADGSAFAGMLGTSSLTLHALRRLRSEPSRYVPLFLNDPVRFLHEEARVDPPVTSVTAVLPEDTAITMYPHKLGKVTFAKHTPYQLVISTANLDPLVFGGPFHSRAEAMRFNPSRENMEEVLSWNGRLSDVAVFRAPRGCPGYKLSMLLARSLVTHFAPSAGALPIPLDPDSTAARSSLPPVDQMVSTVPIAPIVVHPTPTASSLSGVDKFGFSIWFIWCVTSVGYLYGKGGIGTVSVRYMQYLAFQAFAAVGYIFDAPTLCLFGEMLAGTAYVLIYITISLQSNPALGRRYSFVAWGFCFLLMGLIGSVLARVGMVPTLQYISHLYYGICALFGVASMVYFYRDEKYRESKEQKMGSSLTDYQVWTLQIPYYTYSDNVWTYRTYTRTFTYGEFGLIGAFFGVVDLFFVGLPDIGHFVSRFMDSLFYVTPILFVVHKMDNVYPDGNVALPRWRTLNILLRGLTIIVLFFSLVLPLLWMKLTNGDICAFEYTYPTADDPRYALCRSTPLTKDMDNYGRFMFTITKTFVGADPPRAPGEILPPPPVGSEEHPLAVKLPKYDRPLDRIDVFPNPGGFHLTIPTEDEDVEEEASWIYEKAESALHALLKSTTVFPFRDSNRPWRNIDQAHKALTLAGGNRLPLPVTNWTGVDVTSDTAISMMVFAGFAGTRLKKLSAEELTNDPDHALWKCDFSELVLLEVRPGFERFGATAFFNSDRKLVRIFWAAPGLTVRPTDNVATWQHAKFVWRSSAIVGLTATEHLMVNHLIYSNIASTAARESLPKDHPIRRFLKPFNHRTPSVNMGAQKFLTSENSLLHRTLSLTYKGLTDAFRLALKLVRLHGNPLQEHIGTVKELGDRFPFAQDGLEYFQIVRNFVEQYFNVYYTNDDDVRNDYALMNMWNSVRVFGESSGLPPWSAVTKTHIIDVTSTYIFHVTGLHHVVGNVAEYLMDPTFTTGRLRVGTNTADVEASMYALLIAVMTGARAPKLMNDFTHLLLQDPHYPETSRIFNEFQGNLTQFSQVIHERNVHREWKFHGFDPERLLSSVSI